MFNDFEGLRYTLHLLEDSLIELEEMEFPLDDKHNNKRLRNLKKQIKDTIEDLDHFVNEEI